MRVIDISDPANPDEIGFYDTYRAHDVFIKDHYAYIADDAGELVVIGVTYPANPISAGYFDNAIHLDVDDHYIYVADNEDGLYIIDFDELSLVQQKHDSTALT